MMLTSVRMPAAKEGKLTDMPSGSRKPSSKRVVPSNAHFSHTMEKCGWPTSCGHRMGAMVKSKSEQDKHANGNVSDESSNIRDDSISIT